MLNVLRLAWLSLVRQPARTRSGRSRRRRGRRAALRHAAALAGLVVSFRDLLDRAGFDVRVLATDAAAVRRAAHRGRETPSRPRSPRCLRSRRWFRVSIRDVDARVAAIRQPWTATTSSQAGDGRAGRVQFIGADPQRQADVDAPRRPRSRSGRRHEPSAARESHDRHAGCRPRPGSTLSLRGVRSDVERAAAGGVHPRRDRRISRSTMRRPRRWPAGWRTWSGSAADEATRRGHAAGQIATRARRRRRGRGHRRPRAPACTS